MVLPDRYAGPVMARRKSSHGGPQRQGPGPGASEDRCRAPRKTLQLCTQVRRALELAVLSVPSDEVLDLSVEDVQPAPDDGRLLVVFMAHGEAARQERGEVMIRLEALRPFLINEVAQSIHRSRMPELAFELIREPEASSPPPSEEREEGA